jgi:hypothetical protein
VSSADEGAPVAVDSPALDRWPTYALDHTIEEVGLEEFDSDRTQCTIYPPNVPEDETLTAWCSMQLERPVKWIATRTGSSVDTSHSRHQLVEAEAAGVDVLAWGTRFQDGELRLTERLPVVLTPGSARSPPSA